MSSITQTIPNYISGISEQPDELKTPGQVTVAKNVIPDVTKGLIKRPGGKLIHNNNSASHIAASDVDSKWFHYYRDETEQYIGQLRYDSGEIKMWRCDTGAAVTVTYGAPNWTTDTYYNVGDKVIGGANQDKIYEATIAGTSSGSAPAHSSGTGALPNAWKYTIPKITLADNLKKYLKTRLDSNGAEVLTGGNPSDSNLQCLTLNDHTYITNRSKTVKMLTDTDNKAPVRNPEAFIELKKVAYARQYAVNLYDEDGNNTSHYDTVETVTRISVDRVKDSGNSCSNVDGGLNSNYLNFRNDATSSSETHTSRCDDTAGSVLGADKLAVFGEDGLVPNVSTKIFSISGNVQYQDLGDSIYPLTKTGTTYSNFTTATKKNLSFRITTTGQSVSQKNADDIYYQARYQTTWDLLHGGQGWEVGDEIYVWMKLALYKIRVEETSISKVQANLGLIRPNPTSFDTKTTVTAESILGSIRTAIAAQSAFADADVQQIGNGIYLTKSSGDFNISTPVSELLNVLSDEVKDVADLPQQCKHGYVVKVANSEAEEDDYYVKFVSNNGNSGTGVWEECPKPGSEIKYDPETMPIELIRTGTGQFLVKEVTWQEALVGDTIANGGTNPRASFVGKTINKMVFFRNRLVMLSDENVIMSQPGEFFNFWSKSAITHTTTDMIDLSCSSEYPAIVYDGIQVNSGLVLFTKNQQFMLTTDSDVLSPLTAKINSLSSYNFNFKTNPVSLGTTLAFLDNAGKYTRFWEMAAVLREGEPTVIEQSKTISRSFDSGLDLIANSRENQVIFFGKKGTKKLHGFKYHAAGSERIQQAWFNWELTGEIQHIAMLDDALYAIIKDGTVYTMQRFSIRGLSDSLDIVDDRGTASDTSDDVTYRVHLDNSTKVLASAITYTASTGKSTFTKPSGFNTSNTNLVVISYDDNGDNSGRYSSATINGANVEIVGDWSAENVVLGYNYDMEVQFPTIYLQSQEGERYRSQVHNSLVVHRVKLSLGPSGLYTTILNRIGKDNYEQTHESPLSEIYSPNRVAVNNVLKQVVPIYERNTNLTLTLKSTHPTPATLYSMTWEGDYTDKFYKSV